MFNYFLWESYYIFYNKLYHTLIIATKSPKHKLFPSETSAFMEKTNNLPKKHLQNQK